LILLAVLLVVTVLLVVGIATGRSDTTEGDPVRVGAEVIAATGEA
jgi:hypothetical protein